MTPAADARKTAGQGLRILVVEDETDILFLYRVMLEGDGHEVTEATNGLDAVALAVAGADAFDLVLLDMMLPDLDGFGVLAALAADARTKDLPVVIASARIAVEDQLRGLRAGAVGYLTKPFSIDRLVSTVRSIGRMTAAERTRARDAAIARLGWASDAGAPDASEPTA